MNPVPPQPPPPQAKKVTVDREIEALATDHLRSGGGVLGRRATIPPLELTPPSRQVDAASARPSS